MGYDRFCKLYAAYVQKLGVTSRVEHKAGRTIEVDWAGKDLADRGSGHRGFVNGVSVRGRAAVQPVRVRGTHARHGAELVAAGPRGDVRVVRRFHAPPGVRQSEDPASSRIRARARSC